MRVVSDVGLAQTRQSSAVGRSDTESRYTERSKTVKLHSRYRVEVLISHDVWSLVGAKEAPALACAHRGSWCTEYSIISLPLSPSKCASATLGTRLLAGRSREGQAGRPPACLVPLIYVLVIGPRRRVPRRKGRGREGAISPIDLPPFGEVDLFADRVIVKKQRQSWQADVTLFS